MKLKEIAIGSAVVLALGYLAYLNYDAKRILRQVQKDSEKKVSELTKQKEASEKNEIAAKLDSAKNLAEANKKDVTIAKLETEKGTIKAERDTLKQRIAAMGLAEVVVKTVEIIKCSEVTASDRGMLMTEPCAKINLIKLVDGETNFTLLEKEKETTFTLVLQVSDLRKANDSNILALKNCDDQKVDLEGVVVELKQQLKIEKAGKQVSKLMGVITGGAVGVALGVVIAFLVHK